MEEHILGLPKQLAEGYGLTGSVGSKYKDKEIKNIVIAGMGGSGLPGNILRYGAKYLDIKTPLYSHKSYGLPHVAGEESLVVVISYSGNTEEALSSYAEAISRGSMVAAITTGGKLAEEAKNNNSPLVAIPSGIQPRMALGYQFSALLAVLSNAGVIASQEEELKSVSASLDPKRTQDKGKSLAGKINGTLPIFYSSEELEKIAYILKIQMNENAKQHAFYNCFPEMNHNELEGFEAKNDNNLSVVMIKDTEDPERIRKRMELTGGLIEKKGYPLHQIDIDEENWYSKVFSLVLFGSWLSYYLAIENNIEPEKVDLIEEFKQELS